jgi:hypothetical protein
VQKTKLLVGFTNPASEKKFIRLNSNPGVKTRKQPPNFQFFSGNRKLAFEILDCVRETANVRTIAGLSVQIPTRTQNSRIARNEWQIGHKYRKLVARPEIADTPAGGKE